MPRGLNRTGDFRNGTPVDTSTHNFGNVINWQTVPADPAHFGNAVTHGDAPDQFGNAVTWSPDPAHFGNPIS